MSQTAKILETGINKNSTIRYWLHLPDDYEQASPKKWPVLLFLHGSGERGDDPEKVKIHGIPKIAGQDGSFPFIALSPQCPAGSSWDPQQDALIALVDETIANYNADAKRVYVTGLSMGGYGTWHMGCTYPDRFAAIAPICGGGDPEHAAALKNTPVWAFHGAKDTAVPLSESEIMVKRLESCGGSVKFTVYPEANHNCWTETYNNPELYEWFLRHSL